MIKLSQSTNSSKIKSKKLLDLSFKDSKKCIQRRLCIEILNPRISSSDLKEAGTVWSLILDLLSFQMSPNTYLLGVEHLDM